MSEVSIPDEVVDHEAYYEYVKYSEMKAILRDSRMIETSNEHIIIDPFWNQDTIDKNLNLLPFNEKEEVMKKVKVARLLQNKMLISRAKAYGKSLTSSNSIALGREQMKLILDERQSEILEYYGKYLDDGEILKIIHLQWGYNISKYTLERFKEKNKKRITSLQEGFRQNLDASKLYHKRFRLEEIWFLYKERKRAYEQHSSREDVKLMMALIKQAKDEAEAHQIHITGQINHKVEIGIANHIEREIMAHLTIQDIILARVSHRLNVNPAYIINRLHKSVYAKFTGFDSPDDSLLQDEIVYPSTMIYDWSMIKRKHTEEDGDNKYAEFEAIDEKESSSLSDIRAQLKDRLKEKNADIQKVKNKVEKNTNND